MKSVNVQWTHDTANGYGRMGTELVAAFQAQGIRVIDGLTQDGEIAPVSILMSLPCNATGWYEGQYKVLLTMWEGTRLPETMREGLDNYDLILVPSMVNKELYAKYHDNVHYVPLGFNPVDWQFRKRPPVSRSFRFFADGRGGRKGSDLAIDAFKKAFRGYKTNGSRPQLMLKGNRAGYPITEDVKVLPGKVTDAEEIEMYASAHVFLAPARGEGWGMQPLQAIAQGCPTILTNAHGHAAFADLGWGLRAWEVPAEYFVFGDAGNWWQPDVNQMVEYMRWMYENYEDAKQMAQLFSEDAHAGFTWEQSARELTSRIDDEMFLSSYERHGLGNWKKPVYRLYPVVMRIPWKCEIAGTMYLFEPGKLYHETAEVKRILFESGWLDPACLETGDKDNGLNPKQIAESGAVTAQHGGCPTCGQPLNSRPMYELEEAESH